MVSQLSSVCKLCPLPAFFDQNSKRYAFSISFKT